MWTVLDARSPARSKEDLGTVDRQGIAWRGAGLTISALGVTLDFIPLDRTQCMTTHGTENGSAHEAEAGMAENLPGDLPRGEAGPKSPGRRTGEDADRDPDRPGQAQPPEGDAPGVGGAPGPTPDQEPRRRRLTIVAVGASAGGLEALQALFSRMPQNSGMGFVVVTHVRPQRPSLLPELLANVTALRVVSAEDAIEVAPDTVVVAKDSLLSIDGGVLCHASADSEPETIHHPIDHFFRDLAQDQGEHAIGVVLSGSGNDGMLGIKAIKAAGGMVMVQDPDSAKYTGMPLSAIGTGLADYVLAPEAMPDALVDYCGSPFFGSAVSEEPPLLPEDAIRVILLRLRGRTGHDFTCYKRSTISRRIHRRMNVHHIEEPQTYLRYLQDHGEELEQLLQDLLISVTSFFRDPEAFAALAQQGIPRLLEERADGETLRVWVAGCATGEEAYSVAILLDEAIRGANRVQEVQIFATDLDAHAIETARHGLYSAAIAADVSADRLRQYFIPEDDSFRIRKNIRDSIVFAVQNLITDPPFTRMDLVVCRNVLIYLNNEGQQRVLPTLHYALRPGGLLFLGSAESVGNSTGLFEVIDARHKILRRSGPAAGLPSALTLPSGPAREQVRPGHGDPPRLARAVERLLLERHAPCSVLVDDQGATVYLHGPCGLYLEPEQGMPRNNLIDMVRPGGARPLATALAEARRLQQEVVREAVPVKSNGGHVTVDLAVTPLSAPEVLRGLALVTIKPRSAPHVDAREADATGADQASREDLEQELRFTRESLSTTIEELQTANEELKSSNEELQSTNEELHSSNEELETSREEMQSLNEELNTVNAELQSKLEALTHANDDMRNLLNSTEIATIFLDGDLRVKRYTERARDLVRLIESDIGRPLADLTSSLRYEELLADCQGVLRTLIPVEKEVRDEEGCWHLVRVIPYRRADNVIDGLVLTIVDIDATKKAEERARAGREHYHSIVQTVREPTLMLDAELRIVQANPAFLKMFATPAEQVEGQRIYELGSGQWNIPKLRELLDRILPDDVVMEDFRVEHDFPGIGQRAFLLNARLLPMSDGDTALIIMAFEDVTPRKTA